MNTRETMQALLLGEKIQETDWGDEFIHLDEHGKLVDQDGLISALYEEADYQIVKTKISYDDIKNLDKKIDESDRNIKLIETALSILEKRVNDNFQKLWDQMDKGNSCE